MRSRASRKDHAIQKLEKLLDVAGIDTPWITIARQLRGLTVPVLEALVYRIERARSAAYTEGELVGRKGDGVR